MNEVGGLVAAVTGGASGIGPATGDVNLGGVVRATRATLPHPRCTHGLRLRPNS